MEDRATYSVDDYWADLDRFAIEGSRQEGDIATAEIMEHYNLSKSQACDFIKRAVASGEYEYVRIGLKKVLRRIKK